MTREELIRSNEYVTGGIQLKLLNLIEDYMKKNNLNRDKLAKQLGVTKGYVSQLFNASYDHKLSKLVDLALSCNAMPLVYFIDMNKFVEDDAKDLVYELVPMLRPKDITYELKETISGSNNKREKTYNTVQPSFGHINEYNKLVA